MVKVVGAGAILTASAMIGRMYAKSYSDRPAQLVTLQSALQLLETEMRYTATTLEDALRSVADLTPRPTAGIFARAADKLASGDGRSAREAWIAGVRTAAAQTALASEDVSTLCRLGDLLGSCDLESQIKHIRLVGTQLGELERQALREVERSGRLYAALGVLAGLAAVIWLY